MNNITKLYHALQRQEKLHRNDIFNYAVPKAWNTFGFFSKKRLRSGELLVNPYQFYLFSLEHMLFDDHQNLRNPIPFTNEKAKKGEWITSATIYSIMMRTMSAWDHDRDETLGHDNLYHLSDNGTFLKNIILLPYLKRMGIDTILLHSVFTLSKSLDQHTYAPKECIYDFMQIDENLKDPLVDELSAQEQFLAFIEACHCYGIRVILEYCPGMLSTTNAYMEKHPDWFYWIKKEDMKNYHAPSLDALPSNTIPSTYVLKDFYACEDVINHLKLFQTSEDASKDFASYCLAPTFSDQINAHLDIHKETTNFNFYLDLPAHAPKKIRTSKQAPYLLQDSLRPDLHPGKKPNRPLWDFLNDVLKWYLETLQVDGIYLAKPYLLPEKLQKELATSARKTNRNACMIAEDSIVENSAAWVTKGYHAISGNGGYQEANIWDFCFHTFAYRLKDNVCPMFATGEFYDSRRLNAIEGGKTLSMMLNVMNLFLPNGIPMYMNGVECYEKQPMQLSEYGDPQYLSMVGKDDLRYRKQAYLDEYYFDYCANDLHILPDVLERCQKLRHTYLDAIVNPECSIPVWFDSPKDFGLGYSFVLADKALMVVCNTNYKQAVDLHIHTENLYSNLPFKVGEILQIDSTKDRFLHDVDMDCFRNLNLHFDPGEVKFIEFRKAID